jgi:hypothetical protein
MAVLLLVLLLAPATAVAQRRALFVGTVQWTSTSRVQVMTDLGASVSVDVSGLDQTIYTSLRSGDRVRVMGYVAPDRNRIIAEVLVVDVWNAPQTP